MNLNQLKYFITVAECRNFTLAARQHFISQTAVTQQIQSLEEQLGVLLFDRTKRPIALTPAGQVFLGEAKAVCERMNLALDKTKEAATGLTGSLRVGYTKGYERSSLSNVLRDFHQKNPNILISCYRQDTDSLSAGLLNGDYDVIFTWDSTNLAAEETAAFFLYEKVPLVAAMPATHPFAHRSTLTRRDLKHETILYMTPSSSGFSFGDNHFLELYRKAGYTPNIAFRSNDAESILMMVAAEEGISILPAYTTDKLVNAENIVFVPLIGKEEYENILCVWIKDNPDEVLKRFIQTLQ